MCSRETRSLFDSTVSSRSWTARNAVLKVTDGRAVGAYPVAALPTADPRDRTAAGGCDQRPASPGRVRPRKASPARGPRPELRVSLSHHCKVEKSREEPSRAGTICRVFVCTDVCVSLSQEKSVSRAGSAE